MKKATKTKHKYFFSIYGIGQGYNPEVYSMEDAFMCLEGKAQQWLKEQRHSKKYTRGPFPFEELNENTIGILLEATGKTNFQDISILKKEKGKVTFFYRKLDQYDILRDHIEIWKYKVYS
jgi:hypothetical protein